MPRNFCRNMYQHECHGLERQCYDIHTCIWGMSVLYEIVAPHLSVGHTRRRILCTLEKKDNDFVIIRAIYKVRVIANFSLQWIRAILCAQRNFCRNMYHTSLRLILPECQMSVISGDWLAGKLQLISVTLICGRRNNHNFLHGFKNTFNFIAGLAPIFHLPVCDLGTT